MSRPRRGFTLVETATVVAVIAVLIALLLPAVQATRESARRSQCFNNLSQIGLALANYEAIYRSLPAGAVDTRDMVDDIPIGYRFGWMAQILPFLERRAIANHLNFDQGVHAPAQLTARLTAINTYICPSDYGLGRAAGTGTMPPFARSLYAACHHHLDEPIRSDNRGAFPLNGHLTDDDFPDGRATTIFAGEKSSSGDEAGWAVGSRATLRNTGLPPNATKLPPLDTLPSVTPEGSLPEPASTPAGSSPVVGGFGSYHPGGANFLFGDGSVRFVRVSVRLDVYRRLGQRDDGGAPSDDSF